MRVDKGLYQDSHPLNQPEGTYRDMRNGSLMREEGAITIEGIVDLIASITNDNLIVIGSIVLNQDKHLIFSVYTDLPQSSEIGILDARDETYSALLKDGAGNDEKLNFDENTIIQGEYKINPQGDRIVYWTDDLNPPRFLNIDDLNLAAPPTIDFDVATLRIFPQLNTIGNIITDGILVSDGGGALLTGSYFFAIAYATDDGTPTNYFEVIGPIPVNDDVFDAGNPHGFDGAPQDTSTNKSINISLEDLNTNFPNLKVAVLKASNLADVRFLPETPIDGDGTATISYTGSENFIDGSLDEVLINLASYEKAAAITQLDSILYLGNLERGEDIGYQKFANGIEVEPVVKITGPLEEIGSPHSERDLLFHDGNVDHRKLEKNRESRGYKRGEVYALYISLVLKDGSETAAYHIPGRPPEAGETDDILSVPVGTDPATYQELSDEVGGAKHYQLVGRTVWPNMSYWENENESYPNTDDFDIWETDINGEGVDTGNTLQGANVRHHYFPDSVSDGGDNTRGFFQGFNTTPDFQITGFKLKNVHIPNDIRDSIIGYKVYYAKRTLLNRRIIDQGMLHYAVEDNSPDPFTDRVVYSGFWPDPPDTGNFVAQQDLATIQPFHMIRQQERGEGINLNLVTHLHEIYHLSEFREWDTNNAGQFVLPTPEEYVPKDRMLLMDFKTYIEKGGVVDIPTFSPDLANVGGPSCIGFKLRENYADSVQTRNTLVNLCQFRRNMYNPFTSQELVYTQYFVPVGDVGNVFNSPNIFGGDTFVTFYGQVAVVSNISDGGATTSTRRNVTQYVCESPDNIAFRHREEPDPLPDGETSTYYNYWPLNFPGNPILDFEDDPPWINAIFYNDEYSILNEIKPSFPKNPRDPSFNKFPTRVIRSVQDDDQTLADQYRIFRADDFKDFPKNRGEITVLKALNGTLIVHTERTLFRTKGREELITEDFRAFLGAGDIFSVEPEEIFNTEGGYAGCQDPLSAIVTPSGYFFIDREEGRIYNLSDGLRDISSMGMLRFFQDNLDREFTNPEGRLISGYDRRNNRVFFTRSDGVDSWTLSFVGKLNVWESFHDGVPDFYINGLRDLFATKGNDVYRREKGDGNQYFGQTFDFEFEKVINPEPRTSKVVRSVFIDSTFLDPNDDLKEVVSKHFDSIRVRSDHQDTGVINIVPFPTVGHNARRTKRIWKVNSLRDSNSYSDLNGVLPGWATKRRMIGKHALVRIIHDNSDGYTVHLFDVDIFQKLSIR